MTALGERSASYPPPQAMEPWCRDDLPIADPAGPSKYYRARYYDPKIGRFLSEDPIGFEGGANFFQYVQNNPIRLTDPFGLISIDDCLENARNAFVACNSGVFRVAQGMKSICKTQCANRSRLSRLVTPDQDCFLTCMQGYDPVLKTLYLGCDLDYQAAQAQCFLLPAPPKALRRPPSVTPC